MTASVVSAPGTQATIRIEETGNGLRVLDDEDGTVLAILDGISLDFIDRWASAGGIPNVDGLAILDGDALVDVDLPDAISRAEQPAFFAEDGGLVAHSVGPDGLVRVHRSTDGRD